MAQAVDTRELIELAEQAPAAAIAVTSKMLRSASALLGNWTPLANCAIANVPGPRVPLYLQGARLTYVSAIMPISDGMGLVFSVTSYSGMMVVLSSRRATSRCPTWRPSPSACATASGIPGVGEAAKRGGARARGACAGTAQGTGRGCTACPANLPRVRPCTGAFIEYESLGDPARPAIVLIMGLGMQLTSWPDEFCQRLVARGYRVVPLRQPRLRPFRACARQAAGQPDAGDGTLAAALACR